MSDLLRFFFQDESSKESMIWRNFSRKALWKTPILSIFLKGPAPYDITTYCHLPQPLEDHTDASQVGIAKQIG